MTSPTYHNPDNLDSPGEGWRFLLEGERIEQGDEFWDVRWELSAWVGTIVNNVGNNTTYRTRRLLPTQTEKGGEPCAQKTENAPVAEASVDSTVARTTKVAPCASNAAEGSPTLPSQPQPSDGEIVDWLARHGVIVYKHRRLKKLIDTIADPSSLRTAVAKAMKEGK